MSSSVGPGLEEMREKKVEKLRPWNLLLNSSCHSNRWSAGEVEVGGQLRGEGGEFWLKVQGRGGEGRPCQVRVQGRGREGRPCQVRVQGRRRDHVRLGFEGRKDVRPTAATKQHLPFHVLGRRTGVGGPAADEQADAHLQCRMPYTSIIIEVATATIKQGGFKGNNMRNILRF